MTTHPRLNSAQAEEFHREGFLTFREPVLAPNRFASLVARFEEILEEQTKAGVRPEALDKPHFIYPDLLDWVICDEVLDIVEPLIGPDINLFSTHFICKPQGDGRRVPWHEDSAYWKSILDPMEAVTVWLAIDPSSPANGGMYVVPRTHKGDRAGFSDYEDVNSTESVFATEIVRYQRKEHEAIAVVLAPNECSLHDAKLIHGSPANTSDTRRCGFTMRFVPGHVRLHPDWEEVIRLYPARGKDLAGNRLNEVGRAYPELADAAWSRKLH
jgi:ectoine hydroxylase-related dioxygenase (phytanoyl-CoA dioxygenase family)